MTESHTSKNIMELISAVFNTWCIENKTCAIVCDNAPNMVKGVQNINQGLLVRCASHNIQLSINIGLNNDEIKDLINKLRSIVGHFHRSTVSQSNLESEQTKYQLPKNKLVQDFITRWNSTLEMMSNVLKNLNPINNALILNPKTDSWHITLNEVKKWKI